MREHVLQSYQNNNIGLDIREVDSYTRTYWVKGSIGYIEFKEDDWNDLLELLVAYEAERNERVFSIFDPWKFWSVVVAIAVMILVIAVVI